MQAATVQEVVPGVVMIVSCHKFLGTRVADAEFGLREDEVRGWPVHVIVGDPALHSDHEFRGRTLVVRCEDSYCHLLKKVACALRALLARYDVQHGVLRCGDDLVFNRARLYEFLEAAERGEVGGQYVGRLLPSRGPPGGAHHDAFMVDFFATHPEDFGNPLNGLAGRRAGFGQYCVVPSVPYVSGVIMYLGVAACLAVVEGMERVGMDVFASEPGRGFPYLIEDIGIGYLMDRAGVAADDRPGFYSDHGLTSDCLAYHTNRYR